MKVLVVDDDVVSRMVLMHLVDACGNFDILEAEDGEDAWQQLAAGLRPSICFCDLRMPRMSGLDLLQRIKADPALCAMPFVLMTAATDSATVDRAAGLGAHGYLVKPFDAAQIGALMAPVLAGHDPAGEDEAPQATMQRLGIGGERLQVYLGGFQCQLTSAAVELAAMLARGEHEGARARLDRLHAGCLTLGLAGAAAALRGFPRGPIDNAAVQAALAGVVGAVMRQGEAAKRLPGEA